MDFTQLRTSLVPISKSPSGDESVKTPGTGRTASLRSNAETPAFTQKLQQSLRKDQPTEAIAAKEEKTENNEDAPSKAARSESRAERPDNSRSAKIARETRSSGKGSKSKTSPLEWIQSQSQITQAVAHSARANPANKDARASEPVASKLNNPQPIRSLPSSPAAAAANDLSLQEFQQGQLPIPGLDAVTLNSNASTAAAANESNPGATQQELAQQELLARITQERLSDVIGQSSLQSRDPASLIGTVPGQLETYQLLQDISLLGNAAVMHPITPVIQQRPPTSANEFVDVLADRMGLDLDLAANNRPLLVAPQAREMPDPSFFRAANPDTNMSEVTRLAEQIANLGSQFDEFHFEPKGYLSTPQVATLVPSAVTSPAGAKLAAKQGNEGADPNQEFLMMIGSRGGSTELPLPSNRLPMQSNTPVNPMDVRNMTQPFPQPVPNAVVTEFPALRGYSSDYAAPSSHSTTAFSTHSLPQTLPKGQVTSAGSQCGLLGTSADFGPLTAANSAPPAEAMRSMQLTPSGANVLPNSPVPTMAGAGIVPPGDFQTSSQLSNNNPSVSPDQTGLNLQTAGLAARRSTLDPMGEAWLQEERDQRDSDGQNEKLSNLAASVFAKTDAAKAATSSSVQNNSAPAASLAESVSARAIDAANRMALQGQTGQARLTIRDSSIGSIDVLVSVNGRNSVAIDLQTNSSDIKKKLEGQVEDLKERLHGQKFQSVDVKVVADNNASAGFDASQGRGQNRDSQSSPNQSSERQSGNQSNGSNSRNQEQNPSQSFANSDSNNSRNKNSRDVSRAELRPVTERIQNGTARNPGTGRYSGAGSNSVNAKGNLNIRA
jgi:hypothetical protein